MTTKARKRTVNPGLMKTGVWNVRGCCRKNKKNANVRTAVIEETKKKLKGSQLLDDYILLYIGVPKNKRAASVIAIMIKAKFKKRILCYVFVKERILKLRYKLQRGYLTLLAVYAPEEEKTVQTEEFYETLQDQIDKISKDDYTAVAGVYNARVGNIPTDGILCTNDEIINTSNGHKLKEFAPVNILKITNTFFIHKGFIK